MKIILTVLLSVLFASCQEDETPKLDCNCGEVINGGYSQGETHILVKNYCSKKTESIIIPGNKYYQYTVQFCYRDEPHRIDKTFD